MLVVDVATDIFVVSGDAVVVADGGVVVIVVSNVDIIVVTDTGDVVALMVIPSSLGARKTNFNSREIVTANIVRTMKDMQIILTRGSCHHLRGPIFLGLYSLYRRL
jgi:hypothetical protein